MKVKNIISVMCTTIVFYFVTGCYKLPQSEIDSAEAAIKDAVAENADFYCSQILDSAQTKLDSALAAIKNQKKTKISFLRIYTRAKRLLREATSLALSTKDCVKKNKEKIHTEIREQVKQAETAIEQTKKDLVSPLAKREVKENVFKRDLDSAASLLILAQTAITNNDFRSAKKITEEVNEILDSIEYKIDKLLEI